MKTLKTISAIFVIALCAAAITASGRAAATIPEIETLSAQEITVTGTVSDADSGDPLVGVLVSKNGTALGVVTDVAGRYSIRAAVGDKLMFSYIGYDSFTLEVTGAAHDVKLQLSPAELEEVVVVGYGATHKAVATGSVTIIRGISSRAESTVPEMSFDDFSEDMVIEAPMVTEEVVEDVSMYDAGEIRDSRRPDRVYGQRRNGAGVITAGEWCDLDNWDFWRNLLQKEQYREMPRYWGFENIDRKPHHAQQMYTPDCRRQTPCRGRIIEVAFMVDATGSMSDELEFLKTELVDVVGRVEGSNPEAEVSTGAVFYRDVDDRYVTRMSPFTRDVYRTADFIRAQHADGGGDFPEAVHTALERSVEELQWTDGKSEKILFMLLDAPPHHRPEVLASLHNSVARASEKGIRIIPIVASGIDKETEFLMRFIAISTDGTYVFITDHSGVGNSHLEASVGRHRIELLNDLIVRLINKYAM